MVPYEYSQLSQTDSIRLLQLLPCKQTSDHVQCTLLEATLWSSDRSHRPYEALSYCWEGETRTRSITIVDIDKGNREFEVTENLHAALVHLRDYELPRVIWVDAVSIDQSHNAEKEHQIQLMAEIYARASQVVVWLGDSRDGSDDALLAIQAAATRSPEDALPLRPTEEVSALFKRSWFRRVWVLQEVAAARHILVMCGSTQIDGHAFSLGLSYFRNSPGQVAFLMRGAVLRPRRVLRKSGGQFLLNIASLAELLDMYRDREATKAVDRICALLGMCIENDIPNLAALEPNYELGWKTVVERLIKSLFGGQCSLKAWSESDMPAFTMKGHVLGYVSAVERKSTPDNGNGQVVELVIRMWSQQLGKRTGRRYSWSPRALAKRVLQGDVVCLFQGCSRPTIVRSAQDCFEIVAVAISDQGELGTLASKWPSLVRSEAYARNFLLVWDWSSSAERTEAPADYAAWTGLGAQSTPNEASFETYMEGPIRSWDASQILRDVGRSKEAETLKSNAAELFHILADAGHLHSQNCRCASAPYLWIAEIAGDAIAYLSSVGAFNDTVSKDYNGRGALCLAARNGHTGLIKRIIETSKASADVFDPNDPINNIKALVWAAHNGRSAVLELLLDAIKIISTRDMKTLAEACCG